MIVMKCGGSSVVSAMGKTTDRLLEAAGSAARGKSYPVRPQSEALRRMHANETRSLLGQRPEPFLRDTVTPLFRELLAILVELSEERQFTPGIHAAQVDARKSSSPTNGSTTRHHCIGTPTRGSAAQWRS